MEPGKEKKPFIKKIKEDENIKKSARFVWRKRIEIVSGALMLIGIILSFFYIHIGGLLVGLGFGIGFFEDILAYFLKLRNTYSERGIFKTLMSIGVVLYFLIAIPAFLLAAAIGFGIMYLIRLSFKM